MTKKGKNAWGQSSLFLQVSNTFQCANEFLAMTETAVISEMISSSLRIGALLE